MKKVVLAALLTCVALALSAPSVLSAQDAGAAAPAASGQCQMPDAEYQVYNNANTQTDNKAKAAGLEAYLTQFPNSCGRENALTALIGAYYAANDYAKAVSAADRVLQIDPTNVTVISQEAVLHKALADAITDPDLKKAATAKQPELDQAASYAQKALAAPKPANVSDADFTAFKEQWYPLFYSVLGATALNKSDTAGAIDAYKKELAFVQADPKLAPQLTAPGPVLQDTYYLGVAYYQSQPADYLNCAFYVARFVTLAPEPYKTQFSPTAKYCYKQYHGKDDGYDKLTAVATANLNPPADLATTITPKPTPPEIIAGILKDTPPDQLATSDKEYILQNGTPDEIATVWNSMKGKTLQFPDVLVISSTPTQVQVAISTAADPTPVADFTFNMKAPEDLPEHATLAQKNAYKKKQDAIAAAIAAGQKVTLTGTFDSYTAKPLMITMTDGEVILPEAKPAPKAPVVHHTPPHRAQ